MKNPLKKEAAHRAHKSAQNRTIAHTGALWKSVLFGTEWYVFFMLFLKCSGILNLVADKFSEYRKTMMFYSAFWVSSSMTARLHSSNTLLEGMTGVQFDGGDPTARKRETRSQNRGTLLLLFVWNGNASPLVIWIVSDIPFSRSQSPDWPTFGENLATKLT